MRSLRRIVIYISSLSIFAKLILGFLVILIPLYVFNFYVINIGVNKNRQEIHNSLTNSVHSYRSLLDTEFQRIKNEMEDSAVEIALLHTQLPVLQVDETGIPLPSPEKASLIIDVREQLNNLQTTSRFIEKAQVYLPQLGEVIANNATVSPIFNETEFESFKKLKKEQSSGLIYHQDGQLFLVTPYIYETDNELSKNGLFMLKAEINNATIKILLDNIISYKSGGVVLFPLDQSWDISTKKNSSILSHIMNNYSKETSNDWSNNNQLGITNSGIEYMDISGKPYILVFEYSQLLNTVLLAYARTDDVFVSLETYNSFFLIMSILSVLVIVLFSLWLYKIIHKPLTTLVTAFRRVEHGELGFVVEYVNNDEFGYLYESFNDMLSRLGSLIHEVYEQRIRSQHSELKRLQSQINPHFLYNSFFVLSRLIYSQDIDKASQFVNFLSRYFQFITRDAANEISLEKEVENARTYTDIQTICYSGRIQVHFGELPEYFRKILVPRLILQPMIENSYKHGFENKLQGAELRILFNGKRNKDSVTSLSIIVEDNGDEISDEKVLELQKMMKSTTADMNETTGLYNVHRRIYLRYGLNSGIIISRSSLGGLKVEIVLNYGNKEEDKEDAAFVDCR